MSWRRIAALALPLAVLLFALGFIVGLDARRGPDWRLELDAYVARQGLPSETVAVQTVRRARKPWLFTADMGGAVRDDALFASSPPQEVRCALLVRSPVGDGAGEEASRQVVFLVRHSDALYQVGWLAYEGPVEPFGAELRANLETIGCSLPLD